MGGARTSALRRLSRNRPPVRKRYGQHFLVSAGAAGRIVELVQPREGDLVLEVGPGTGALTRGLVRRFDRVVAVEIDRDLAARLSGLADEGFALVTGDVLQIDFADLLLREGRRRLCVVGNLPYNISAPFLFKLLQNARLVSSAVLTLQREVAQRLVADPGSRTYGAVTVLLHQWCSIRHVLQLPPKAFRPTPQVQSWVLQMEFSERPRLELLSETIFEGLVRAAFGQRRKMLRNALQPWWASLAAGIGTPLAEVAEDADIDLSRRAEALTPSDFAAFSNAIKRCVDTAAGVVGPDPPETSAATG